MYLSVLLPAFYHNNPSQNVQKVCADFFSMENNEDFEIFELVPIKNTSNFSNSNKELAIKLNKTGTTPF